MKTKVVTLENKAAGEIELNDAIFGLEPRKDLIQRVVEWQRAKARAGTHKVKNRNEVSATTKKPFRQKGTGNARQGSLVGPHQTGGGKAHGPVVRSHAYSLPRKVRALGMKHALSAKQSAGKLVVIDDAKAKDAKTSAMASAFAALGWEKPLIIAGEQLDAHFVQAVRNLKGVDVLPSKGANVYDILRHKELVLTKDAVEALQARLS
ncbi:MAG: 50S ribosomal protein L4 [Rickettsiales bacterium]|nr:50S ribosomal protein L4 [Rickettsiales bacterium]